MFTSRRPLLFLKKSSTIELRSWHAKSKRLLFHSLDTNSSFSFTPRIISLFKSNYFRKNNLKNLAKACCCCHSELLNRMGLKFVETYTLLIKKTILKDHKTQNPALPPPNKPNTTDNALKGEKNIYIYVKQRNFLEGNGNNLCKAQTRMLSQVEPTISNHKGPS